jgi:hypothetical protein
LPTLWHTLRTLALTFRHGVIEVRVVQLYYRPGPCDSSESGTTPLDFPPVSCHTNSMEKTQAPAKTKYRALRNVVYVWQGKRVAIPAGKTISEIGYRNLPNNVVRSHFTEVHSTRGWVRWSEAELDLLCQLYVPTTVNSQIGEIVTRFLEVYPERSFGSVHSRVWGCVGLDAQRPEVGLGTYSEELAVKLNAIDSDRFPLVAEVEDRVNAKLDNLLAAIRG